MALLLIIVSPTMAAPNFADNIERPLRYRPDGADFVIENGTEFFNRPLYGTNTAFRVDGATSRSSCSTCLVAAATCASG
jgi:hypothetical protein